jgi:iron(III) transport system ATP-binding protein
MSAVVQLEGVTRVYPGQPPVRALDGVSLRIDPGELVGVVGPSGSGKTTLLNVLGTLDRADAGLVRIDGCDVAGLTDRQLSALRARRIGFVFQQFFLAPGVTALDNVADGLLYTGLSLRARRAEARRTLERVGLGDRSHHRPHELSGGQQQRVALARAMAREPAVVLLDEPFSNLDAALRAQVRTDVHRILVEASATAVFVTHDQEEALALAAAVAVMASGQIAQLASPAQLYLWPADRAVAGFVGEAEFFAGVGSGTTVQTELGVLPLAVPASGAVEVLIRPEDIRLARDDGGDAVVLDREFYGHDQMLFLRLPTGRVVRVRLGPVTDLSPGDRCRVAVPGPVRAYPHSG